MPTIQGCDPALIEPLGHGHCDGVNIADPRVSILGNKLSSPLTVGARAGLDRELARREPREESDLRVDSEMIKNQPVGLDDHRLWHNLRFEQREDPPGRPVVAVVAVGKGIEDSGVYNHW